MASGTVPVMTKGSLATYFGGADVVRQIEIENAENIQPSIIFPAFFIVSSVFQIVLYLYKNVRSSHKLNIQSYAQTLRKNLGKYIVKPRYLVVRLFFYSGECVEPVRSSGPDSDIGLDVLRCPAALQGYQGGTLRQV